MTDPLLMLRDLAVDFEQDGSVVPAVRGVSLDVARGETLGLVGESGSGKSVTMLTLIGLLTCPPARVCSAAMRLAGEDLRATDDRALRDLRGRTIAMIFQDPHVALNPVLRVDFQIGEVLERHLRSSSAAARARSIELLHEVGVPAPETRVDQFSHQLSGGMRQRVMIAMALAGAPKLLVADEPTTALDVTVQAEIIELVKGLQARNGMAMIWVTHDLAILARLTARVAVMYAGRIVELARAPDLYRSPAHPYTHGLLRSIPRIDQPRGRRDRAIPGSPPNPRSLGPGCRFATRCPLVVQRCQAVEPDLQPVGPDRSAACWRAEPTYEEVA